MYSLELQKIYFPLVFNRQKKKKRLLIKLSPCTIYGNLVQYKVLLGGPVFKHVDHSVAFPPVEKFHKPQTTEKIIHFIILLQYYCGNTVTFFYFFIALVVPARYCVRILVYRVTA